MNDCEADGRWNFAIPAREGAGRGARIGSFIVTLPHGGGDEVHPILKGNVTGFPDFTAPPGPLEPVTVDARDASPGSEDVHGQSAGRNLGKLFPGNTLVNTDGTLDICLKGAEYYAPGGQLFSLGCGHKDKVGGSLYFSIWLLRWRMEGENFCTTGRMEPDRYVCLTGEGQNNAVLAKGGPYPPPAGRLAVQLPSSENASLLRGNIFDFKYSQ